MNLKTFISRILNVTRINKEKNTCQDQINIDCYLLFFSIVRGIQVFELQSTKPNGHFKFKQKIL